MSLHGRTWGIVQFSTLTTKKAPNFIMVPRKTIYTFKTKK
jgi:hypothetical protein